MSQPQSHLPERPLAISVVGHTNTGKTSLMRTLTRDSQFGNVSYRPGTTRHVEAAQLLLDGRSLIELYDTPGIEDPIALLEHIDALTARERLDGPERIRRFLDSEEAAGRFEQEAKVLKQMLASDAAFFVVDVRDPVLAKHRDELALLRDCGVPLLPLLNFVSAPDTREPQWREALARTGLHAVVRFDTVTPERDGERQLYEKLASLLDHHEASLKALVASREQEATRRHEAALRRIAELLINVAACRQAVSADSGPPLAQAVEALNDFIRSHEQQCTDELLALYQFRPDDLHASELPLQDGHWPQDLFDPVALQVMGERIGGGAAAGAAAGAGIDLMVGGLTLGAATAVGALAGGGLQTLRHYGRRLWDSVVPGQRRLSLHDNILRLVAARQLSLVGALEARGHAATDKLHTPALDAARVWTRELPRPLRLARAHPEWSAFSGIPPLQGRREQAIDELARALESLSY